MRSPMSFPIDQARPVREGEQLDVARLDDYLAAHFRAPADELAVEQFPHGHSNLTYLITVGAEEWVLRRPPFGNRVKTAHDMGREYRILSRLCQVYPPAPRPVLFCEDEVDPGCAVLPDGAAQRASSCAGRPRPIARSRPSLVRRLCETLVDRMAELHALDLPRGRPGRPRQAPGLRRAPGHRLDQALPGRPHRRRSRPRANDATGWPRTARPSRPAPA